MTIMDQNQMVKHCMLSVPPSQSTSSTLPRQVELLLWLSPKPLSPAHCFPVDQSHRQHTQLLLQWSPWWPVWELNRGTHIIANNPKPCQSSINLIKNKGTYQYYCSDGQTLGYKRVRVRVSASQFVSFKHYLRMFIQTEQCQSQINVYRKYSFLPLSY